MFWSKRNVYGEPETMEETEREQIEDDYKTMMTATRRTVNIILAKPGTHQPIIMGQPMQDKKKRGKT